MEGAQDPLMNQQVRIAVCGCHTVLKLMKLTGCWCSLTTPANNLPWWIQDGLWKNAACVLCVYSEHAEGPLRSTSRPELLGHCGCHTGLKFIKLTRCWCLLITPTNKPSNQPPFTLSCIICQMLTDSIVKVEIHISGLVKGWVQVIIKQLSLRYNLYLEFSPPNKAAKNAALAFHCWVSFVEFQYNPLQMLI